MPDDNTSLQYKKNKHFNKFLALLLLFLQKMYHKNERFICTKNPKFAPNFFFKAVKSKMFPRVDFFAKWHVYSFIHLEFYL